MLVSPGTKLGPYEIVAPLGSGGMGVVYRAHDPRLGRDVAIKSLPPVLAGHDEQLERLRREARTLAALSHPHIAAIYGLEEIDDTPFLVLELVEGETLGARLLRGPIPPAEAIELGIQIAAALAAAHERGIVHRDLKPGNVAIAPDGTAKVLDFGLAKTSPGAAGAADASESPTVTEHEAATASGVILGTAAYMSPEQVRGRGVDRRSDVWSFACLLFECLAARRPFAGDTVSDLIAAILERDPDWSLLPEGTAPRLRELLRRCLRKDAAARPRDMRDVGLELRELAAGLTAAPSHEKSIAVLPFENLSDAAEEYFADGVTDEILNALAHLEGLRVAARTSCFAFKGRREDLRVVGEKLDVAHVLEGSVRRAGPRLRITARLASAADGYQLWSERYDRELTDVFQVQEEIAEAIASRLRVTLSREADRIRARRGTTHLEAYELLLKGRALQNKRGRFLPEAIACFERAIELDPGYGEAIAWLADSYRLLGTFGAVPFAEAMPRARSLAERALAHDSGLAEAWATLAGVQELYERDYAAADATWRRALEADPRHARNRGQRAMWAYVRGTMTAEQALAETRRAQDDDPLNAWVQAMHSYVLGWVGRHEESIAEAERAFALDADSFFAHWNLLRSHAWAGRHARALELAPAALRVSGRHPWVLGVVAWSHGKNGNAAAARAVHDELEARSRHEFVAPFWLAAAAGAAGLGEPTLRYLERAVDERDPLVVWGRVSPFWDGVREHPRFEKAAARVWA